MKDQPVVYVYFKLRRHKLDQFVFNFTDIFPGRYFGPVGHAVNVGIYRNGGVAEGGIEYHVRGLAAHTG